MCLWCHFPCFTTHPAHFYNSTNSKYGEAPQHTFSVGTELLKEDLEPNRQQDLVMQVY